MAASLRSFPALVGSKTRVLGERKKQRVLLVADDNSLRDSLSTTLQSAGYAPYPVVNGREALGRFHFARPDAIVLGVCLPDMDGKQVLRRLRELTTAPIVAMSAGRGESETIECLDAGADDYLATPFTMGELLARLRAALRRGFGIPRNEVFVCGDLRMDFTKREVLIGNEPVKLTATEYDLLKVLASHAGVVKTHYQLIHELWGTGYYQDSVHLLRVTVSNLRRKLLGGSRTPQRVVTEPGVGYRLQPDSDWPAATQRDARQRDPRQGDQGYAS